MNHFCENPKCQFYKYDVFEEIRPQQFIIEGRRIQNSRHRHCVVLKKEHLDFFLCDACSNVKKLYKEKLQELEQQRHNKAMNADPDRRGSNSLLV